MMGILLVIMGDIVCNNGDMVSNNGIHFLMIDIRKLGDGGEIDCFGKWLLDLGDEVR